MGSTNVQECRDSTVALWIGCVTETAAPLQNPNRTMGMNRTGGTLKALALSFSCSHTHTYSLAALYYGVSVYYKDRVRKIRWRGRIRFSYGIFILSLPIISPRTSNSFKLCAPALIVLNFYCLQRSSTPISGFLNTVLWCKLYMFAFIKMCVSV